MNKGTASVRGIASWPTVNVREGPSLAYPVIFEAPKGLADLEVLGAQADEQGRSSQGKVYQWLNLTLPDGRPGWVRDDLLEISGSLWHAGYGQVDSPTLAFALTRGEPVEDQWTPVAGETLRNVALGRISAQHAALSGEINSAVQALMDGDELVEEQAEQAEHVFNTLLAQDDGTLGFMLMVTAPALHYLGRIAFHRGNVAAARRYLREAYLASASLAGTTPAMTLVNHGRIAEFMRDHVGIELNI